MGAELGGDFQHESDVGAAIVGADEAGVAQGIVGVVMTGEDDDAVFFAGEFGDDVVHREGAGGGLRR